ncbi:MAG: protein kinase, partial [Candidatus Eisenbacteria bacterium]|nr:protein kinase [Candidatus Eisenbacteria bacterium]
MPLAPGQSLGPYQIVGPLGAGGMGEVYLALDPRLDREVALKVLPARTQRDPDSIARFRREALTLASLNHPNLATVHGFEEDADGTLVLVLEKVDGVTLGQRIKQGALGVEESLQICAQVAEALEVAHERGVIHRDIKPGNVMIGPRGLVKVLDFGLAQRIAGLEAAQHLMAQGGAPAPPSRSMEEGETVMAAPPVFDDAAPTILAFPSGAAGEEAATVFAPQPAGTLSMTGMTVGTPGYMSPEQVLADPVDGRTDIFALGVVLFECLSGRRAFPGDDAIQVMRDTVHGAVNLSALPERTPARIRLLVERCLSKSADGRPGDMRDVRIELEEALGIRRGSALREGAVAVPHNLPAPATSFIGREAALAACSAALDGTRLLTLLGMGGSGKTRLALRMAESRLAEFPDGVWFVDVAPLTESERLVEALAGVLGVREETGRTLTQCVSQALGAARVLLLFDNAEALPRACAELAAALLASCRELKVIVTSREPLDADGETTFPVPTLAVPGTGARTAAEAGAFESVLLFTARARAAQAAFELTDENAATVAEICRRLD